ncbi:MAG: HD family phosphohydrolase [Christensenellaceae bacterium]
MEEKVMQYKYSVLEYLRPYLEHESVLKMKAYVQHGDVSTYRHCLNVACYSLYLARKWRWMVDEESLVVGAFCTTSIATGISASGRTASRVCHTALAAKNARETFGVSDKIYYIIRTHMYPLTPMWMPRSKEGWLVCLADKYCATHETMKKPRSRAVKEN